MPDLIEFWTNRESRLHDRVVDRAQGGGWTKTTSIRDRCAETSRNSAKRRSESPPQRGC